MQKCGLCLLQRSGDFEARLADTFPFCTTSVSDELNKFTHRKLHENPKMHTTCSLKEAHILSISMQSVSETTAPPSQALTTEAPTKHSCPQEANFFHSFLIHRHPSSPLLLSSPTTPPPMPQLLYSPPPRWWCGHCNGPYYRGPGGPMTQGLHKHCFNCHRRRDIYSTPPPPAERPRRQREGGNDGRHG